MGIKIMIKRIILLSCISAHISMIGLGNSVWSIASRICQNISQELSSDTSLIDRAEEKVDAFFCTPQRIESAPYTITESGRYFVTADLVLASVTSAIIVIDADNVELDLCGHLLDNTLSSSGISVEPFRENIAIKNGRIGKDSNTAITNGIIIGTQAHNIFIEDIWCEHMVYNGLFIDESASYIVSNKYTVSYAGSGGTFISPFAHDLYISSHAYDHIQGAALYFSNNHNIFINTVWMSRIDFISGLHADQVTNMLIQNLTMSQMGSPYNDMIAVELLQVKNVCIEDVCISQCEGTDFYGFGIGGSSDISISRCLIEQNSAVSLCVGIICNEVVDVACEDISITDNQSFNTLGGIGVFSNSRNVFIKKTLCSGNQGSNIFAFVCQADLSNIILESCIASNNVTTGSDGLSFFIDRLERVILRSCTALGNINMDGFSFENVQDALLENCRALYNQGIGFNISSSVSNILLQNNISCENTINYDVPSFVEIKNVYNAQGADNLDCDLPGDASIENIILSKACDLEENINTLSEKVAILHSLLNQN